MATGNVRERKNKSGTVFQITIENGTDPVTGERLRDFITFKGTRRQAEKEKDRLVAAVNGGNYTLNTSNMQLITWMHQWLSLYCTGLSPTTLHNSLIRASEGFTQKRLSARRTFFFPPS